MVKSGPLVHFVSSPQVNVSPLLQHASHLLALALAFPSPLPSSRRANLQVGWKALDKDGKGHIDANDLRRVCLEMGYKVTERDIENMLMVLAPTSLDKSIDKRIEKPAEADSPARKGIATISFEKYKGTMQARCTMPPTRV